MILVGLCIECGTLQFFSVNYFSQGNYVLFCYIKSVCLLLLYRTFLHLNSLIRKNSGLNFEKYFFKLYCSALLSL